MAFTQREKKQETPLTAEDASSSLLSRSTSRIGAIDGFRALAMLLVLAFHTWQFSGSPQWLVSIGGFEINLLGFLNGNSRVDLFIVLSGFCLFLPLAKSPALFNSWSVTAYAKRRAWRILPGYYAALLYPSILFNLSYPINYILGRPQHKWAEAHEWGNWVAHALFIHTFFYDYWGSLNAALWTMGLEVQFYLVFPLLIFGIRRYGLRFLGIIVALSVIYRLIIYALWFHSNRDLHFLASITFLGRWVQFVLGMLCIWIVMRRLESGRTLTPWAGSALVLAALALHWLALQPTLMEAPLGRDLTLGIAFSLAIGAICLSKTPFAWLVDNWPMRKIGFISYSLFLLHQPTAYFLFVKLSFVHHFPQGLKMFALLYPASLLATIAVGLPFFFLFEWPYLRQKAATPSLQNAN